MAQTRNNESFIEYQWNTFKAEIARKLFISLLMVSIMWLVVSISIQRFRCTKMTETELFLQIPRAFICDWKECN